ncbi:MAG: response regulator, partial [Ginsengibacter sp.]
MWFFAAISFLLVFVAYRYFRVSINGIKLRNQELLAEVEQLNLQLEELTVKEQKTSREADVAANAKTKLLSLLSHEIRTPMNGVIGMTTLLSDTNLDAEQREYADTILDCSKNLLTNVNEILISDMVDFSKLDSENVELTNKIFDVSNCIEEVLEMFAGRAAEAGIDLIYQMEQNVPLQITGDYKRLQQVLINLVENAIRFTAEGEILISVDVIPDRTSDQLQLSFKVTDTGIGIAPERLQDLFKVSIPADYTPKNNEKNNGFGLVICKRIVEQMGGQITVESIPGKSSTFIFNIITTAAKQTLPDFLDNAMIGYEGKQVLIVDDNITQNKILHNLVEQWKLLPTSASSGSHALEMLSQVSFDLVLIDLCMPVMDGIQLGQSIKSLYPKIPLILLNSVNDDRYKDYPGIFNAILSKPISRHKLFDIITTELRHKDKSVTGQGSLYKMPGDFSEKHPLHILVAEDNPINQKWIKKILAKIGYECEIAENGKDVLERVSHEHFDMILMDVQMPEMDGLEATRMIRVCLETQPVIIAMTANVMQGDREECIQSGMNDYISKPVELNELLGLLEKWALLIKE